MKKMLLLALVATTMIWATAADAAGLDGSVWQMEAKLSVKASGLGSAKAEGLMTLEFTADGFILTDQDGDSFDGSYTLDAKGKIAFLPNGDSLRDYLSTKIVNGAGEQGASASISSIELGKGSVSGKVKVGKKGANLTFKSTYQADVDMTITSDGEAEQVNCSVKAGISGKAFDAGFALETGDDGDDDDPPAGDDGLAGTNWVMEGKVTHKVKGLGTDKHASTVEIVFGPNASEGLAAGEFAVVVQADEVYYGTWSEANGKLTLDLEQTAWEQHLISELENALWDEGCNFSDVWVLITSMTGPATVKNGKLSAAFTTHYDCGAYVDGQGEASEGTWSVKLKGTQQ